MNSTTNLGLTLYEGNDKFQITGDADSLNHDMEIIDEHMHNAEVLLEDTDESIAIVVNGNTAPKAITSGQYLFIKNHSSLATGGYHAKSNIASGATISSSNVDPDPNGIANSLKAITDTLNGNINSHSSYASSIVTDNVTINTAIKKTLEDFAVFYLDFEITSAKSAMDNVMHGFPNAINGASYTVTALGHTPEREATTYRFSMTGDGYLKTLDSIPNGTRIRLTFGYFTN